MTEEDSLETGVWFTEEPPEEVIPRRGTELVLNCSASISSEFPTANVTWRKNGEPLVPDPNQRQVRVRAADGSLVIRRVQARSDNGIYQCAADVEELGVLLSRPTILHVAGPSTSLYLTLYS